MVGCRDKKGKDIWVIRDGVGLIFDRGYFINMSCRGELRVGWGLGVGLGY